MSAILVILVVVALYAALGVAAALGRTPDTTDPAWSAGHLLDR